MGNEHGWQAKVDALRTGAWRCGEPFVNRSGEHCADTAFDDAIFNRDNKLMLCRIVKHVGIERQTGANIPDRAFDAVGAEFAAIVSGGVIVDVVVVTVLLTPLVLKRATPLMADSFSLPSTVALDKRLIAGAMLFGIGWGLSGYCPGPAVVSLLYGYKSTFVFLIAMLLGMSLEGRISHLRSHSGR